MSSRAQMVLWYDEGYRKGEIAAMSGAIAADGGQVAEALQDVRYGRSGEHDLSRWAASDPGPDTREGSRVDQDDTSVDIGDIALVINGDGPLHQEGRGRLLYVSQTWVSRLWRENGLTPWRQDTFKISKDPDFEDKVHDVVGLYHRRHYAVRVTDAFGDATVFQARDGVQVLEARDARHR